MLALALASGGLAASEVSRRTQAVEARVGAPVPVVVAAQNLRADSELRAGSLAVREVPRRFAPRDALTAVDQAAGLRTAVPVPEGNALTAGQLRGQGGRRGGHDLRRGERTLEVAVAGGEALSGAAGPGALVDVLVSTETRDGAGSTFVALEAVELVALRAGGGDGAEPAEGEAGAAATASTTATLRLTLRQAVYLTAAQNFAREVRLLPRPPGDRSRLGRAVVAAGEL